MMDASTDSGFVLKKHDWGMIWDEGCQHFHLLVPDLPEGSKVPEDAILLTAVYLRIEQDPEFREDLLDWFKSLRPA